VNHDVASPRTPPARRFAPIASRAGFLVAVVAACSSGLGSSQWLWCRENLAAVDVAADQLGFAKTQSGWEEPTWLPDYLNSNLSASTAVIAANADFQAACAQAATTAGRLDSQQFWCLSDGIDKVWAASVSLGTMTHFEGDTFGYKALSLDKRLDNPEFVQACRTAAGAAGA
jgi:hypothetical protein